MITRPMLAPLASPSDTENYWDKIQYPVLVSPKIDGIRAIVERVPDTEFVSLDLFQSGGNESIAVLSRNMTKFRSKQVQNLFGTEAALYMDGELAYDPCAADCLHVTQSFVSSASKFCETLRFYVFDYVSPSALLLPYFERQSLLKQAVQSANTDRIVLLDQVLVDNKEELLQEEERCITMGYEGVMLRSLMGGYKQNRATANEATFFKLKRFSDEEGTIVGIEEGFKNTNEAETDNRGFTKRSSAMAGKIPNGMLGRFRVKSLKKGGGELWVAPGSLTHAERLHVLKNAEEFIGKTLTFRHFDYGVKNAYRFARFVGFREKWDM